MSSSRPSVITFNEAQDAQSELQFQDFTLSENNPEVATLNPSASYSTYSSSDAAGDLGEREELLGGETQEEPTPSFWHFKYYQSYFDVDTDQVTQRILWSMVPLPGTATFLDRQIRPKPDLYGPFWITTTLIFSTAISANIASYFHTQGASPLSWSYDFHKVSLAATAIYSYAFLLPIILWALMWYRNSSNRYSFTEIVCVYGYSLAIYVPISILWVIQVPWFQWLLVIIGASLSGIVLLQTFWPVFRDENKKIAAVVLCLVLLFHVLLAVGFMTYFFHAPKETGATNVVPATSLPPTPSTVPPNTTKLEKLVSKVSSTRISSESLKKDSDVPNKLPDPLPSKNTHVDPKIANLSASSKRNVGVKSDQVNAFVGTKDAIVTH